jgi:hypothetical protein
MGAFAAALSAVAGGTLLASVEANLSVYGGLIAGIGGALAAALASVFTFSNFQERVEKHRIAGAQ